MGKREILLVEDDGATRELLRTLLEADGYAIVEAANGASGVEAAAQEQPDLILMDIMLPRISGFEAIKSLKSDPRTKHIPILVCSVKSLPGDVQRGLALGADDYVSKPFSTEDLREKVRKLLDGKKR